jgi:DUF4097 and DUF4098 domain-containing protein YvlB
MMKKLERTWLVWAASLFVLIILNNESLSQELTKKGRYYIAEVTKNFTARPGGALRIYDIRGNVEVQSWDKNEVLVKEYKKIDARSEREAKEILEKSRSGYSQRGDVIEIGGDYYDRDWMESDYVVTVPKNFNVDIKTRGGDLTVERLTGRVDLITSGGEIRLTDIDGLVEARTSGGDIKVVNSKQRTSVSTSGGDLDLEEIGGPLIAKTSGGDITLRGSRDRAVVHTSGGDILISDAGGAVEAHTSGGDIEIADTKGAAEVHTSGGDIQLRSIGGALQASTSGGDVVGRGIEGGAEISTSGGDIELLDVKGGVYAKTAGGDITVEIRLTDFKMDHRTSLRTAGGEITLYIPEKMPASIRAEIEITDRWEDYNIYSDFPLTSSSESSSGESRRWRSRKFIRGEGDINGGGDFIELYTTDGDIHIKKLLKK